MRFKVELARSLAHSIPGDALTEMVPALREVDMSRDVYVFVVEADEPPPVLNSARWRTTWSPDDPRTAESPVLSMEIEPRNVTAITEITYRA